MFPHARDYKDASSHKLSAGTTVLTIPKSALPYEPIQGDIAVRVANGTRMVVADPTDDGISDWVLTLSARKS